MRSGLGRALALAEIADPRDLGSRMAPMIERLRDGGRGSPEAAKVLAACLDQAPRVGEGFALHLPRELPQLYDALPAPTVRDARLDRASVLERGVPLAASYDQTDSLRALLDRVEVLFRSSPGSSE